MKRKTVLMSAATTGFASLIISAGVSWDGKARIAVSHSVLITASGTGNALIVNVFAIQVGTEPLVKIKTAQIIAMGKEPANMANATVLMVLLEKIAA